MKKQVSINDVAQKAGVSAATVLGDGRIALILDPDAVAGGRSAGGMQMPNILSNAGRTAYANV